MKPKTMILMGLAVTCGLGASFMTSRLLAERQTQEQDREQVKVLVAKKNLDMGLIIKKPEELFETKSFPKGDEPKQAIVVPENQEKSVLDQLKGRQLKLPRRADDIISMEDLLDRDVGLQLPEGHRAIGLRVNMETGASGFAALPHSRVDVISTIKRGSDRDSFSQILLENVLVLAADTNTMPQEGGKAMPASVVTLALAPEDLLKVTMARELGVLTLALRRYGDTKRSDFGKITVEQIITNSRGGKNEDGSDGDGTEKSGTGVGSFALPKPKNTPPIEVAVAPKKETKVHRLVVIEGDKERLTTYALDENGDVIPAEVMRSEIGDASHGQPGGPRPFVGPPAPRKN